MLNINSKTGTWEIAKQFEFDFGHRVWTQCPDPELSCGHKSICRHFHGHRGTVHVYLNDNKLNDQGMVTDFVNLNFFKKFLDDTLDHKMILDIQDPSLLYFYPEIVPHETEDDMIVYSKGEGNEHSPVLIEHKHWFSDMLYVPLYWTVDMEHKNLINLPDCVKEIYEGLVLVPFVPTSENLSKWLFEIVQRKMDPIGVKVSRVQFFETPKSQSNYYI